MNAKRYNLVIMTALTAILSATPAFAHLNYEYVPAGVWVPRLHAYSPDEIKAACDAKGFELFAGLGKTVTELPKAVGNLLEAIFPDNEQKASMEVSQAVKYRDIQNVSGVVVRIPER